jgi:hypothetical protein
VRVAAATLAIALALGGCADLATTHVRTAAISAELRRAQATHELRSPAPRQHAPGSASPVQAIRQFAQRYVNWNAADVAARMRALARASVGQARSEMTLTAAQVQADHTLDQAGIANHGTVEAVARVRRHGLFVVVTREWTTARYTTAYRGLAPAWHVTLATVARVSGVGGRGRGRRPRRWVVRVWQPQS